MKTLYKSRHENMFDIEIEVFYNKDCNELLKTIDFMYDGKTDNIDNDWIGMVTGIEPGTITVMLTDLTINTIIHESQHVLNAISEHCEIYDNEFSSYYLAELVDWILDKSWYEI